MSDADLSILAREGATQPPTHAKTDIPLPRRKWRTRILLPTVIVATTATLIGVAAQDALRPATPVRVAAVLVKTDAAHHAAGEVIVQAPGWVEADPFPVGVSALADGVVEEMLVLEGERVEAGQVVARLVDEDARLTLQQAEAVLAQKRAALAAAEATLREARQNWEHPIELTRKLRTMRAQLAERRGELERWPAELDRDEAHAVYLKAEYERTIPLNERGHASDIELLEAKQAYESQKAQVEATRRRKPILGAQIASLEAEVEAAEENLRLRIADTRAVADAEAAVEGARAAVLTAEAQRDEAALRLERMDVRSPADGVVMTRLAEPGSKLLLRMDNPYSAQVVRLYDPEKLQVRVDIPLVDAAKVGVGQPAEVIVDVLADRVFQGEITRIVHEADVQKNTLQVKVAIEDPTPEIKPEMLARARFLAMPDAAADQPQESAARIFIPSSAIVADGKTAHVWLADQVDNVARRRAVTLGREQRDDWRAVTQGLQPGDRVIIEPPDDIADGQRIRLIEQ